VFLKSRNCSMNCDMKVGDASSRPVEEAWNAETVVCVCDFQGCNLWSCASLNIVSHDLFFFLATWLHRRLGLNMLILFCSVQKGRNISYQFKNQNKTEQFSSYFKSRSVPDFSAKFQPECSGFIPHVPFRYWKVFESNWTWFNLIN
jgi:hypothetical protein